jgi:hypothetical protein
MMISTHFLRRRLALASSGFFSQAAFLGGTD